MPWLIGTIVVIVLLILFIITVYNSLVGLRNRVKDQWSQIDVQLKRRVDLIPNIVETVKGYAKHEKGTLEAVINARDKYTTANGVNEQIEASNQITGALNKLFSLTEAYPDLKADKNFLSLQGDLKDIEEKIAHARQFYNDTVLTYNNKVEMFPSSIIASMFKFKVYEFFKLDSEEERKAPKVSFD